MSGPSSEDPPPPPGRATFHAPPWDSLLSLGGPWSPEGTVRTARGFTASSTQHVSFRGETGAIVASGTLWLQSLSGDATAISGGPQRWLSGESLYIGSGGYLGVLTDVAAKLARVEADPDQSNSTEAVLEATTLADGASVIFDQFVAAVNRAADIFWYQVLERSSDPDLSWKSRLWYQGVLIASLLYWVGNTVSYSVYAATGVPLHALSLQGREGMLLGAKGVLVAYGASGIASRAAFVTLEGALGTTLDSGYASYVDAPFGNVSVAGGTALTLMGWRRAHVAASHGTTTLTGTSVNVGVATFTAPTQVPTHQVDLVAVSEIELGAVAPSPATVAALRGEVLVSIKTLDETRVLAGATAKLVSPLGFEVELSPGLARITTPGGELLTMTPGSLTLGPSMGPLEILGAAASIGGGSLVLGPVAITSTVPFTDIL